MQAAGSCGHRARSGAAGGSETVVAMEEPLEVRRQRLANLSHREEEVLRAMMAGCTPQAIAARLGTSLPTVRTQIQAILRKTDAHSQLQAVVLAFRCGWAPNEPTADRTIGGSEGE